MKWRVILEPNPERVIGLSGVQNYQAVPRLEKVSRKPGRIFLRRLNCIFSPTQFSWHPEQLAARLTLDKWAYPPDDSERSRKHSKTLWLPTHFPKGEPPQIASSPAWTSGNCSISRAYLTNWNLTQYLHRCWNSWVWMQRLDQAIALCSSKKIQIKKFLATNSNWKYLCKSQLPKPK